MPRQLFTSLVKGSTPRDMVGSGFFKSESPSFALSADGALRSGSSSPAPRTGESSCMVSSRHSLGAAMRGANPRSTHEGSGATLLREGSRSKQSGSFSSFEGVGWLATQSGSHSNEGADT